LTDLTSALPSTSKKGRIARREVVERWRKTERQERGREKRRGSGTDPAIGGAGGRLPIRAWLCG